MTVIRKSLGGPFSIWLNQFTVLNKCFIIDNSCQNGEYSELRTIKLINFNNVSYYQEFHAKTLSQTFFTKSLSFPKVFYEAFTTKFASKYLSYNCALMRLYVLVMGVNLCSTFSKHVCSRFGL